MQVEGSNVSETPTYFGVLLFGKRKWRLGRMLRAIVYFWSKRGLFLVC